MNIQKSKGFSLIEVVFVLGLLAGAYTLFIQHQAQDTKNFQGRELGVKLHDYQTAVRRFASVYANDPNYEGQNINDVGSSWLKDQNNCAVPAGLDAASGDIGVIACDFRDQLINGMDNTTYNVNIRKEDADSPLIITTTIDVTTNDVNGDVTGMFGEGALNLAVITARGGAFSSSLSIGAERATSVDAYMSSTNSKIVYCSLSMDEALLDPACTVDGVVERGNFVMVAEAFPQNDVWLRTDGGNTMNNSMEFNEEVDAEFREIVNVNRIYNVAGEILKLGNSGAFDEENTSWVPVLGDGVVIDTDVKMVGNLLVDGNIETKGEVYAEGDIISEGYIYSNEGIATLGDVDIAGDAIVLGTALYQNGLTVVGETVTDSAYVNSFLDAQEIYSRGNIYAENAISSPYVRASLGLFSEGDLLVAQNSFVDGSNYVGGDSFIQGNVYTDGNLYANNGAAYLKTVFADVIFDNNGNYLIDPSEISRVNIMRANRYAAGTPNGTLNMNANNILLAAENESCTSASEECATSLEGFWDMESLYVKRESTDEWIRLVDWLQEIQDTSENIEDEVDAISDDVFNGPSNPYVECRETNWPRRGAYIHGQFFADAICP